MSVPPSDDALLEIALLLAKSAGELLMHERPSVLNAEAKSSPTDAVTEMDRAAEDLINGLLAKRRPDDGVLGEEGSDRKGTSGVRWIIDPLDGTVNYLYGLPLWSVSVAAEFAGLVRVGVVEAPALGRRYAATRDGIAWREGAALVREPVSVSGVQALDMALVGTGFGYLPERRAVQAAIVADLLPRVRDIRRLGSAALDLCFVADGELDAYYEMGLNPWDVAAGALIARQAGAFVRGSETAWPDSAMTLACSPAIAEAMSGVLGLGALLQ